MNPVALRLVLLAMLFHFSVTAGGALVDACCTPEIVAESGHGDCADDGNGNGGEAEDVHIPHCCHAMAHYSALWHDQAQAMPSPARFDRPALLALRHLLDHAPPVPPPNA